MAETIRLGSDAGLGIELRFLPDAPSDSDGSAASERVPNELAWAELQVAVQGQSIWYQQDTDQDEPRPVTWTLVDLLHGLARIWPWLMVEESYPIPIEPEHPGRMMRAAENRWESEAQQTAELEEERLFDFRHRHDLSLLMRGIFLPPLWFLREGNDCLIWSPELGAGIRQSMEEIGQILTQLGDGISQQVATSQSSRAIQAVTRWHARHDVLSALYLQLATGLDEAELKELTDADEAAQQAEYFGLTGSLEPIPRGNELLLAARMTANYLPPSDQKALLARIKSIPPGVAPELDGLTAEVPRPSAQQEPHQQGYELARWLRDQLGMRADDRADPERLLQDWGVVVEGEKIDAGLDAVAVWGTQHGPAVLLNTHERSRASSQNGRRTTLAHEICHLLVDRSRALPAAEVLGGQAPRYAEKRANAFAAEWLLPRSEAERVCRAASDVIEAAKQLERDFTVSRRVVYHQISNSALGDTLTHPERKRLEAWKGH